METQERRSSTSEAIGAQVAKIREEIARDGVSTVGCEELTILCPEVSGLERRMGLLQIAAWEEWDFQTVPGGAVEFRQRKT